MDNFKKKNKESQFSLKICFKKLLKFFAKTVFCNYVKNPYKYIQVYTHVFYYSAKTVPCSKIVFHQMLMIFDST